MFTCNRTELPAMLPVGRDCKTDPPEIFGPCGIPVAVRPDSAFARCEFQHVERTGCISNVKLAVQFGDPRIFHAGVVEIIRVRGWAQQGSGAHSK